MFYITPRQMPARSMRAWVIRHLPQKIPMKASLLRWFQLLIGFCAVLPGGGSAQAQTTFQLPLTRLGHGFTLVVEESPGTNLYYAPDASGLTPMGYAEGTHYVLPTGCYREVTFPLTLLPQDGVWCLIDETT